MPLVQHDPIEIEVIGIVRGVRLARLTFYPVRPEGQRLRVVTRLQVSLAFNSKIQNQKSEVRSQKSVVSSQKSSDPLLESVRSSVINPDQVQPVSSYAIRDTQFPTSNLQPPTTAIEVASPGLTALTYEALAAAGFPVGSAAPQYVHLTRSGSEIAAEWDGDGDAAFEAGERLLFYADPRFSRYASTDVYFLSIETTSGLRMSSRSAAPASYPAGSAWIDVTVETNALYTPDCLCGSIPPGRDGDRWTWDTLRRPDRASAAYPIDLPSVDATQPATLTLWLIGYTDVAANPDHRVDVSLNGSPPGRVEWNGKQAITASLSITPGILRSGTNSVALTLPGLPGAGVEGMWLDAFSIRTARGTAPTGSAAAFAGGSTRRAYSITLTSTIGLRAYDVTDPDRPLRLTNLSLSGNTISLSDPALGRPRRYALASDIGILSPAKLRPTSPLLTGGVTGADYVVISPVDFMPALTSLIALRQSQGLTVTVESAQAIYDAYGSGRPDPAALRAYLANAYATWALRPTYVLLVGDGTFDPKRYRADTPPTIIPPYLADVDPWAGETAADNRYVTVDGADNLPDMLIGRLPVNTLAETQIVVNKIVQYETQPAPGGWNGNVVFAADNPDSAGNFAAQSEILASTFISTPFTAQRIYYTPPPTTATATQQAILNRWNAGAGLVMYTGHASVSQWAVERLFHRDDASSLNNAAKLPVVLEMTCFTGSFQNPAYGTLDELLVRRSNGGAVAAWGATGLGVSTGHADLADGFMRSVFVEGKTNLGLAAFSGKLRLAASNPSSLDLVDTFTLLGDPATSLNIAVGPTVIDLPLIQR